jgi:hypothetical protein
VDSTVDPDRALVAFIEAERLALDPLAYTRAFYRWGQGELLDHTGARQWQSELLGLIGAHLSGKETRFTPLRIAIASGHGIGKSAAIGMVINWAMSTCDDCRIVVTANTENQLRTKTWPEVAKWARLSLTSGWWSIPAMSIYSNRADREKSWRADATPWSENNTEAFAGLHNRGKRIVLIFDEASAIADKVWEVAEGALTDEDTEIIWLAFGNPTSATGRFRECFGRFKHLWRTRHIDSRTVEGTNKAHLDQMVRTYGEDSDIVRVRVRGVFPAQSVAQFIATDVVEASQQRQPEIDIGAPLIMGVDLARMGDDQSVIRFRSGRDAKTMAPIKWRNRDTVYSANMVATQIDTYRPRAAFVDNGYIGAAVVDILHSRGYHMVTGIDFGGASDDPRRFHNKRSEMWGCLKDWLPIGCIDDDPELRDDLIAPEYHFHKVSGAILLESKEDMKSRGLASPDDGDALALTFAAPVARLDMQQPVGRGMRNEVAATEYPMFN